MPEPRLSRHFLGESCTSAALIPVPQYPHTSLLAVGSWSTDAQVRRIRYYGSIRSDHALYLETEGR